MKTLNEVLEDIKTKPTVPVWPHLALALGISRPAAYAMVRAGKAEVVEFGTVRKRVVSAWLRKVLQLDGAA
jgi:hypothetical protein